MPPRLRLAVLGSPIAHSKSPLLHAAAYRVLGFDAEYSAIEVGSGELADFVGGRDASWRGLSLTMPLKEEVLPLLASVDRLAGLTGAANTVLFGPAVPQRDMQQGDMQQRAALASASSSAPDGRPTLLGFNTDVAGIVRAVEAAGIHQARHVLILGAGATAKSALVAAAQLGAQLVTVAARTPSKAAELISLGAQVGVIVELVPLSAALAGTSGDLTISTLPGEALTADDIGGLRVSPGSALLDVAYHPWPSTLAARWQGAGGTVVSGLSMLLHQALLQVRVFTLGDPELVLDDEPAVLEAMADAVGLSGRPGR
ncbi:MULTISPECIES: shikimate dehydrogenase family protein [Subtercola]|uniref:Shikimate dehydrogenase n=1 Tax=Subtercola vilae TaxID=2056433 RepID=A0A4T2C611_9MICO|nr:MULTISPECIES: shikimate dehydrogenase [Subtercola]MEA9985113.1 shikimate dehydrogenase [Subtercola sp. RTI3]TIH37688.1 shikimate dehydrogenase [Subtercola vilae]